MSVKKMSVGKIFQGENVRTIIKKINSSLYLRVILYDIFFYDLLFCFFFFYYILQVVFIISIFHDYYIKIIYINNTFKFF